MLTGVAWHAVKSNNNRSRAAKVDLCNFSRMRAPSMLLCSFYGDFCPFSVARENPYQYRYWQDICMLRTFKK